MLEVRVESLKKPQTKKTTEAIQLTIRLTNDYMSAGLVLWDSNVLGRERERDGLSRRSPLMPAGSSQQYCAGSSYLGGSLA